MVLSPCKVVDLHPGKASREMMDLSRVLRSIFTQNNCFSRCYLLALLLLKANIDRATLLLYGSPTSFLASLISGLGRGRDCKRYDSSPSLPFLMWTPCHSAMSG